MAFEKVAKVADVPEGTAKQVFISGKKVALFNVKGAFLATQDECSHRAASLSTGKVSFGQVTCPWHGARFDLKTGTHKCPPATQGIKCYKVQVVGEDVEVDVF